MRSINSVLASRLVPVRLLASVIISLSLAIGPVACLRTRALYEIINGRRFWSEKLSLSPLAYDEVLFWKSSLSAFNGRPIWFSPSATFQMPAHLSMMVSIMWLRLVQSLPMANGRSTRRHLV